MDDLESKISPSNLESKDFYPLVGVIRYVSRNSKNLTDIRFILKTGALTYYNGKIAGLGALAYYYLS